MYHEIPSVPKFLRKLSEDIFIKTPGVEVYRIAVLCQSNSNHTDFNSFGGNQSIVEFCH